MTFRTLETTEYVKKKKIDNKRKKKIVKTNDDHKCRYTRKEIRTRKTFDTQHPPCMPKSAPYKSHATKIDNYLHTCRNKSVCVFPGYNRVETVAPTDFKVSPNSTLHIKNLLEQRNMKTYVFEIATSRNKKIENCYDTITMMHWLPFPIT